MTKKKKDMVIDIWDILLAVYIIVSGVVMYYQPTLPDPHPDLRIQFLVTIVDKTFGYVLLLLIVKKLIEKANGDK